MTINGINGANTQMGQMGMNQATDSYSRNIQNQIANAQKQLQELPSNEDMTLEEKMKKRQEIQQQISDLNVQLRQHQMEQRREKQQQAKGSSMDDMLGGSGNTGSEKAGSKSTGLSQASMTAMISAGTSMKQAKVQGSVATKMEGRAGILESEIKLDKVRGNDTQKKEEELADVQQKAQAVISSQLSTLADASKTMEEATKADSKKEKADDKDAKTAGAKGNGSDENASGVDTQGETVSGAESVNTKSDLSVSSSTAAAETTAQRPTVYKSVDIRL
ncbi:MAG: FlxA-like family protein [Lachnospiraceae bacterium]|nr:FlxA-like family protein [Lachnospiraceae bacterium]